jgi:hypothetical protein
MWHQQFEWHFPWVDKENAGTFFVTRYSMDTALMPARQEPTP